MKQRSALILGGGMSGMAAAYALSANGWTVTLIEAQPLLGGLAGSFERDGRSFPLGYHHILHRDRTLQFFLDRIGALEFVRWRRIRMFFRLGGRSYDLSNPLDFLAFPMGTADKASFVRLMLRAFRKSNWDDWHRESAEALVDAWASPGVRKTLFEPLSQIKFGLPCAEVSGAWLGARLYYREGSAPLGYLPGRNWTEVLCSGLTRQLAEMGVSIHTRARITRIATSGASLREVELESGDRFGADFFVSTIPPEILLKLLPDESSPGMREISYTALSSVICATAQRPNPDFYWMNLVSQDRAASGIFMLDSLNPTLGTVGESYVNFVTHTRSRALPFFSQTSEQELIDRYRADYREVFGEELEARWIQVNRVPMYSPVLVRGYRNPPLKSTSFSNLYFAGNYRTFPSVVTTGTALHSGLEAAEALLAAEPDHVDVMKQVARFRPPSMLRRLD